MFKHLALLFDNQELPSLVNRYEDVRVNGDPSEVAAIRENIARILKTERKKRVVGNLH
jgi:hypothetical protein